MKKSGKKFGPMQLRGATGDRRPKPQPARHQRPSAGAPHRAAVWASTPAAGKRETRRVDAARFDAMCHAPAASDPARATDLDHIARRLGLRPLRPPCDTQGRVIRPARIAATAAELALAADRRAGIVE